MPVGPRARRPRYSAGLPVTKLRPRSRTPRAALRRSSAQTRTCDTVLPSGTYCDIIHGSVSQGSCSGPTITVGPGGMASVTVAAKDSVALDGASRLH